MPFFSEKTARTALSEIYFKMHNYSRPYLIPYLKIHSYPKLILVSFLKIYSDPSLISHYPLKYIAIRSLL